MLITSKGRYALRMMIDIAVFGEGHPVPLKDVSRRQDLPPKYLEQLVRACAKAGLLKSVRGQHGGYSLAVPASEIPVGAILRAAEGSTAPTSCQAHEDCGCPRSDNCLTLDFWNGLEDVINQYVDATSLADLATPKFVCTLSQEN